MKVKYAEYTNCARLRVVELSFLLEKLVGTTGFEPATPTPPV
jgi:hypothetical protein